MNQINGSDNGLPPCRHKAIMWTNAGISSIEPLGIKFNEILVEFYACSLKKKEIKLCVF